MLYRARLVWWRHWCTPRRAAMHGSVIDNAQETTMEALPVVGKVLIGTR
jgi:hypothetical protein